MTEKSSAIHGWLAVHKPLHMTSFDVVRTIKRLLPRKTKIGHGGTLDPLASGVLPIAIGEATKTVDYLMHEQKEYIFEVAWGAQTKTDDAESLDSEAILHASEKRPTLADINTILPDFTGHLTQLPPLYSAKKIDGKRACDRMREGEEITLQPSSITIYDLQCLDHTPNKSTFKVCCSKGTYVRSLARDMGMRLGCYGHAASILRSRVGNMTQDHAKNLAILTENGILSELVQPIQTVLADIPAVVVTPDQEAQLRHGQVVVDQTMDFGSSDTPPLALCVSRDDRAIAIVEVSHNSDHVCHMKPKRVFNIF